jgi:hypothetical protein
MLTLLRIALIIFLTLPIHASILWDWSYSTSGIVAGGTFTSIDTPDANGGYLITAITGIRNAATIVGLQPTGTPIPGNEPFDVDNLIFASPGPQLTKNGFGFALSDGSFSNPFYADFLPTPAYLEFFSDPPSSTELEVQFSAVPVSVPEPASFALAFAGLAVVAIVLDFGDNNIRNRESAWQPF